MVQREQMCLHLDSYLNKIEDFNIKVNTKRSKLTYDDAFIELAHSISPGLLNVVDHLHQFFRRSHFLQRSLGNRFKLLADTAHSGNTSSQRQCNAMND